MRKPIEEVWTYEKLETPFQTELAMTMSKSFGDIKALEPIFRFSWNASSELGVWGADRAWVHMLADDAVPKLEGILNKEMITDVQPLDAAHRDLQRIKDACSIVKAHTFKHPLEPGQLSPKVKLLLSILARHFGESVKKKCIVFTKQRNTARILLQLTRQLEIPNLRPGILVGARRSDITGSATLRSQFLALVQFRKGDINCLVSTHVHCCKSVLEWKSDNH